jgi:hypothetical protein
VSQDGFGTRTLSFDQDTGEPVEVLTFAPVLAREPEFAAAVGERVARLARVRHAMYARARKLDRPSPDALRLLSDHVQGWRLDHVLDVIEREQWTLDVSAVITLLRQLIPAVALFSRHQRDATIGTIGPERLLLTPQGRLVLAEYVLAPGLEKLHFPRERLWREFRVAVPHDAAPTRIPPSADVVGIGVVATSLLLGRRLKDDEYLVAMGDLFDSLTETSAGSTKKLSATFRTWVARALQFEPHTSYQSVQEAQLAFEEMLAKERSYVTTASQLDRFITHLERVAGAPRVPSREPEPVVFTPPAPVIPVTPPEPPPAAAVPVFTPPTAQPIVREAPKPVLPVEPVTAAEPAPVAVVASAAPEVPAWKRYALPALMAVVVIQSALIAWLFSGEGAAAVNGGQLTVQSRPAAARVSIDSEERGTTPFETAISPGSHVIEVRVGRSEPRVIPIVIREGIQTNLYVELQSVATVGGLEVRSEPAKARVTVGGQYRGETPLVLKDLPPGEVEVVVQAGNREVKQSVRIEPGITSQLVVPLGR